MMRVLSKVGPCLELQPHATSFPRLRIYDYHITIYDGNTSIETQNSTMSVTHPHMHIFACYNCSYNPRDGFIAVPIPDTLPKTEPTFEIRHSFNSVSGYQQAHS